MTECNGASCLLRELVNPEPQTMVFYVLIGALVLYAARRGRNDQNEFYDYDKVQVDIDHSEGEEDDDDLPPAVLSTVPEDDDDDLELLDELDDL